uniref:Uncharacterized protein n=1 Tax=Arundo donax TaxID=35708 RepID=A0A0A9EAF6_ARUDO
MLQWRLTCCLPHRLGQFLAQPLEESFSVQ